MSRLGNVHWARWAGVLAGVLVLLKTVAFVTSKVVAVAKNEVEARGGDVSFVLGLAERRSHPHGG